MRRSIDRFVVLLVLVTMLGTALAASFGGSTHQIPPPGRFSPPSDGASAGPPG